MPRSARSEMPTRSRRGADLLVDTSVAVALTVSDHEHHHRTFDALTDRRLGLAGHAAFETFSVLTRLPPPARRTPSTVARLLNNRFPHSRFLSTDATAALFARLESDRIAGGSVYDALVGAAAAEHRLTLATRDQRALEIYRTLGVMVELVG
jgi:predicted nucleic acid-binding protein